MSLRTARDFVNWYDIGFPAARHKRNNGNVAPCNVVFLLGWMECRNRHLSPASSFYAEKGYAIVRYYPVTVTFTSTNAEDALTKQASHLVDVLRLNNLDRNPVYFHCFGLTGAVMYHFLLGQLGELEDASVAGVVFDSGPVLVDDEALLPERGLRKILRNLVHLFASGHESYHRLVTNACLTLKKRRGFCPELYLYSKGDKIVDYKSVEGFVNERIEMGVFTDSLLFEDSNHVDHMRCHPDQYFLKLESFVVACSNVFNASAYPATGRDRNDKVAENLISRL